MTNEIMGYKFELWVAKLFKNTGEYKVKHNVLLKHKYKNISAQFDVSYGFFNTHYVECKYRRKGSLVKFSEVATFAAKLKLFNISYSKGIFVTNSFYEKRALAYAKEMKIKTLDGNQIYDIYNKNNNSVFSLFFKPKESLETVIKKYKI